MTQYLVRGSNSLYVPIESMVVSQLSPPANIGAIGRTSCRRPVHLAYEHGCPKQGDSRPLTSTLLQSQHRLGQHTLAMPGAPQSLHECTLPLHCGRGAQQQPELVQAAKSAAPTSFE